MSLPSDASARSIRRRETVGRLTALAVLATVATLGVALARPIRDAWLGGATVVARTGIADAMRTRGWALGLPTSAGEPPDRSAELDSDSDERDDSPIGALLERRMQGEPGAPAAAENRWRVTRGSAALREHPSEGAEVRLSLPAGTEVRLVREQGTWALVFASTEEGARFGWIQRERLAVP